MFIQYHNVIRLAAKHLSPPEFQPPGYSVCFRWFAVFSSAWGNPAVGGGDQFYGSYNNYVSGMCCVGQGGTRELPRRCLS